MKLAGVYISVMRHTWGYFDFLVYLPSYSDPLCTTYKEFQYPNNYTPIHGQGRQFHELPIMRN